MAHVLRSEAGDVGLAAAGVPEEFEVEAVFLVGGDFQDGLVLLASDAASRGVADLGPGAAGEDGLEDSFQIEGAVVKDPELDVGGNSGPWVREDGEKVGSRGLDESPRHKPPDRMTFQELLESCLGIAVV